MTKKNNLKLKVAFASISLALVFVLTLVLSLFITKANADTYTVYDDGEYYSETTYYLTKNAYNKHLEETEATTADKKSVTKSAVSAEGNDSKFVIATAKKICVLETKDEAGNIIENRPLKKAEIERLTLEEDKESHTQIKSTTALGIGGFDPADPYDPYSLIGKDNESIFYLTIELSVTQNNKTLEYTASGTSRWTAVSHKPATEIPEERYFDYIGLTWGGEKNIHSTSFYTYAKYLDGTDLPVSRKISDSTTGYVWQFYEKYNNSPMDYAVTSVNLKRDDERKNETTNVRMTYIHTYEEVNGSLSFSVNANGAAASISFSTIQNNWQIEVDVYGIKY